MSTGEGTAFMDGARVQRYGRPVQYEEPSASLAIGVIVPFDFELDWEYWKYLPRNVTLYFTRTPIVRKPVGVDLAKAVSRPSTVWQATQALLSVDPEVVLYACSSGSFIRGRSGECAIREAMLEAGASRAVTTSNAMVEALQATEARRITLVAPYTEPLTERLVDFASETGFEVVSARYLDIDRNMSAVDRKTIRQLVLDAHHPDADAVFVSCTALRTYGIVAELEREIGVPVFTSNQVSLWAALCAAGAMYRDVADMDPDELPGRASPMARSTAILLARARETQELFGEVGRRRKMAQDADGVIVS